MTENNRLNLRICGVIATISTATRRRFKIMYTTVFTFYEIRILLLYYEYRTYMGEKKKHSSTIPAEDFVANEKKQFFNFLNIRIIIIVIMFWKKKRRNHIAINKNRITRTLLLVASNDGLNGTRFVRFRSRDSVGMQPYYIRTHARRGGGLACCRRGEMKFRDAFIVQSLT